MSRDAHEMAKKWASHNEGRFIPIGLTGKIRRAKASGCGRNTSYDGDRFISYRTPIASYFTNPKIDRRYVLITNERFSRTTDDHMKQVRYAAKVPVFTVPYLAQDYESMVKNADFLVVEARIFANDAKVKWKADWGMYADGNWQKELTRLYNEAVDYVLAAGVVYSMRWSLNDTIEDVKAFRKLRWDMYNDPKASAKRERARARRLANAVI